MFAKINDSFSTLSEFTSFNNQPGSILEHQIVKLVDKGKNIKQIASETNMSIERAQRLVFKLKKESKIQ